MGRNTQLSGILCEATAGGVIGEQEVYSRLEKFFEKNGWTDDNLQLTGAYTGAMRNNKTGDIVIEFDGSPDRSVAVEVKFDKTLSLGDWSDGDSTSKGRDTALSQLFGQHCFSLPTEACSRDRPSR